MKKINFVRTITALIIIGCSSSPGWSKVNYTNQSYQSHKNFESSQNHNSYDKEYYTSSDGSRVHRPSRNQQFNSEPITAECRDGTHSYSHHHRGTCSHHRGVAEWK